MCGGKVVGVGRVVGKVLCVGKVFWAGGWEGWLGSGVVWLKGGGRAGFGLGWQGS